MSDKNREYYNRVWRRMPIQDPSIWPSWDICGDFIGKRCLEIGSGSYPRIPLEGSYFLDISETAVDNLKAEGLNACLGTAEKLPFEDSFFDLVVVYDVLEHIDDDQRALSEIQRVLKPRGHFLFSVPVGSEWFSCWDRAAGHKRRYDPAGMEEILMKHSFQVVKFRSQGSILSVGRLPFLDLEYLMVRAINLSLYLPIPPQIWSFVVRGFARFTRAISKSWRTDRLANACGKGSLTVLCQKR